jgi:hypothetical protein
VRVLLVLVVPRELVVPVLLVRQAQYLVVVVWTGTAGQQSWSRQKAVLAVVGTALAVEEQIEVAQSLLAEAGNTALVQVLHMLLAEQHMSPAVAVRTPWLGEPRIALAAVHTGWEPSIALAAARKQPVEEEPHMSLAVAARTQPVEEEPRMSLAVAART